MTPVDKEFEIIKILLDKGVLALLLLMLGGIGALFLERFRTLQSKQLEIARFFIPQIDKLVAESSLLFDAGNELILDISKTFSSFIDWADRFIAIDGVIVDPAMEFTGEPQVRM